MIEEEEEVAGEEQAPPMPTMQVEDEMAAMREAMQPFIAAAPTPSKKAKPTQQQPGLLDEVKRGLIRGAYTGPSSMVDLVGYGAEAGLRGAGVPENIAMPSATQMGEKHLGVPTVSTPMGRIAEGVSGGATLGAIGGPAGAGIGAVAGGLGATAVEATKLVTDNPYIQGAAGILGGLSGGTAMRSVEAAGKAAGTLIPSVRRRILDGQLKRLFAGHIPDIDQAMATAQDVQGVAQRTGTSLGLAEAVPATQRASQYLRQSDPQVAAAQNTRLTSNVEKLLDKAEQHAMRLPSGTPDSARKSALHRKEALEAAEEAKTIAVKTQFEEALDPIRKEVGDIPNASTFGEKIRTGVKASFDTKNEDFVRRYGELDMGVQVDPSPSIAALKALEAGVKKAEVEDLPSIFVRDIIENLGRKKMPGLPVKQNLGPRGNEPLNELIAVRSRILSEIMTEKAATAPNKNKIRLASQLMEGVQANIDQAIANTPNAALKQINTDYKSFMGTYASDPVDEIFKMSRAGLEKKSNIDVFNEFTSSTGGKGIERFQALQAAVGDKEARTLYGEALMAKMMLTPGVRNADGTFNPKPIQKFIEKNERVLQELPVIQKQMTLLNRAADKAVKAPKGQPTIEDFDNSWARSLVGEDPRRAISLLVKSGNMEEGLKAMQRVYGSEPASFRALARPLWDGLMEEAGMVKGSLTTQAALGHKEMGLLLQKHQAALTSFYGKEAYDGLVDIQRAARLNAASPIGLEAHMKPEQAHLKGMLTTIWSRAFGIARGVIGHQFIAAEAFSKRIANLVEAFDEKEIRVIMDNMLHDKDLITTLTKVKDVRGIMEAKRNLKRWVKTNVVPTVGVTAQQTHDARQSE